MYWLCSWIASDCGLFDHLLCGKCKNGIDVHDSCQNWCWLEKLEFKLEDSRVSILSTGVPLFKFISTIAFVIWNDRFAWFVEDAHVLVDPKQTMWMLSCKISNFVLGHWTSQLFFYFELLSTFAPWMCQWPCWKIPFDHAILQLADDANPTTILVAQKLHSAAVLQFCKSHFSWSLSKVYNAVRPIKKLWQICCDLNQWIWNWGLGNFAGADTRKECCVAANLCNDQVSHTLFTIWNDLKPIQEAVSKL